MRLLCIWSLLCLTDLHHGGVRVVQEVTLRNVPAREVVTLDEETNEFTHFLPVEMDETPSSLERNDAPQNFTPYPGSAWTLEREYIHAADPGAYVDEVLAQLVYLDADGNPAFNQNPLTLYTLRDANFNVVALADEYGRLAAQYTYDPYGKVRSAELMANPATGPPSDAVGQIDSNATTTTYWHRVLAAARTNRLGFQGLPAERLDVEGPWLEPLGSDGLTSWGGGSNTDILGGVPPASHEVVYHARNRVFSPRHQRFTSVDPNGVGVPVLDGLSFGGMAIGPSSIDPDYLTHFGDGMNAHAAFGGNPLTHSDPGGLFSTAWLAPAAPGMAAGILHNAIIGGLLGGLTGGFMESLSGGSFWNGVGRGGLAGIVGGATYGFAASLSGIVGSVASAQTIGAMVGGAAGGASYSALYGDSARQIAQEALVGAFAGGALSFAGRAMNRWLRQADDVVFEQFLGGSGRNLSAAQINRIYETAVVKSNRRAPSVAGNNLKSHANRTSGKSNPFRTENPPTTNDGWDALAMKHIDDIVHGPGDFVPSGRGGLDKRLPDGRGLRLNPDGSFRNFLDPYDATLDRR